MLSVLRSLSCVIVAGMLTASGVALAQPAPKATKRGPTTMKQMKMKPIIVKGVRHQPQVFYVLPRSDAADSALKLKKSFVPRIVESVNRATF